jgi:protein phosphatase 1 regulatory subunit 7
MGEPDAAPRSEVDPTKVDANGTSETRDEIDDHKPRDSKGWDGKLRVDKLALSEEPKDPNVEIESDAEVSEDEGPPPEQLPADEDLLDDTPEDEEDVELVHCKISDMNSLHLERFTRMKVCITPPSSQSLSSSTN